MSDRNNSGSEMPSSELPTVSQSSPRTTTQVNPALTATPRVESDGAEQSAFSHHYLLSNRRIGDIYETEKHRRVV